MGRKKSMGKRPDSSSDIVVTIHHLASDNAHVYWSLSDVTRLFVQKSDDIKYPTTPLAQDITEICRQTDYPKNQVSAS